MPHSDICGSTPIADPRSFSQLIASFFASESLGILHTLLSYFSFSPMCSIYSLKSFESLSGLLLPKTLKTPSLLFLLLLQHVNELFARFIAPQLFRNGSSLLKSQAHPATLLIQVHGRLSIVHSLICNTFSQNSSHPIWMTPPYSPITYHLSPTTYHLTFSWWRISVPIAIGTNR